MSDGQSLSEDEGVGKGSHDGEVLSSPRGSGIMNAVLAPNRTDDGYPSKRREAMIPSRARSLWTVVTAAVVVAFAASLVGCAGAGGPLTPVMVSDVKSVAGTWRGKVHWNGSFDPERVELTIREDGSYDIVVWQPVGTSRGKGTMAVDKGRLATQGEKGRGMVTLLTNRRGDRFLSIEATLADNRILSADLSPVVSR
jgi:hypothetical protein